MSELRLSLISRVNRPRGLKGEIKCDPFDRMPREVFIAGKAYTVKKATHDEKASYIFLDGIDTIDLAERLRGKEIFVNREDLKIEDDEVLTSDLVGFEVVDEKGTRLGYLKSIDNYGGGYICNCDFGSFPYEDHFVVETNMTSRRLVIRLQ